MRRRALIAGLGGTLAATSAKATPLPPPTRDLPAMVRTLVTRYADAWNAGDMAAMGALYTRDVHWVNIMGMHWRGFEEVDYAHRTLLATAFKGVAQTLEEIESIVLLEEGCVVAVVRWAVAAYTSPSGQTFPPSRTRMSLTLVQGRAGLLIAHGANIQIVEPAQRNDPVVRRREREAG